MASIVAENKLDMKFLMQAYSREFTLHMQGQYLYDYQKNLKQRVRLNLKRQIWLKPVLILKSSMILFTDSDLVTGEYRKITQKLFDEY